MAKALIFCEHIWTMCFERSHQNRVYLRKDIGDLNLGAKAVMEVAGDEKCRKSAC